MSYLAFLIVLATALSFVSAYTPKVVWSQTNENLNINIMGPECVPDARGHLAFTFKVEDMDKFKFSCSAGGRGSVDLEMTLREDVIGSATTCISKGPAHVDVQCVLRKKHPHDFDRLVDNMGIHGEYLTRSDASATQSEQGEKETYFSEKEHVHHIDDMPSYTAMLKHEFTLVDVSYPWCEVCLRDKGRFLELTEKLMEIQPQLNHTLNFAYIDAREHRAARRYFSPSCEEPCPFFIVRSGERPHRIAFTHDVDRLVTRVVNYDKERLYHVGPTEDDLNRYTDAHDVAALATLPSDSSAEFQTINTVANVMRGRPIAIAVRFEAEATPKLQVFRPFDGIATYNGTWQAEDVTRFFNQSLIPIVQHYHYDNREEADATGKYHVMLFSRDGEPKKIFESIVQRFKDRANFFHVNTSFGNHGNLLEDVGLGMEDVENPHIGVISNFLDKTSPKFGYLDGQVSDKHHSNIMLWLEKVLSNAQRRTLRSAKRQSEFYAGDLNTVVGHNIEEIVKEKEFFTVVLMYKFHQDHKEELRHEMRDFARLLKRSDVPRLFAASMETVRNHFESDQVCNIEADHKNPTVVLLGRNKCIRYTMRRPDLVNIPHLLQFLRKYVPGVRESWPALQKEIDLIREKAVKDLEEIEARKKAFEEKMDGLPVSKLDKGVVKYLQVPGEENGLSPYEGSMVLCHYRLIVQENMKQVESSYTNGEIFRFKLGGGGVTLCWEQVFPTMTRGEKAILFCPADEAYNTYGSKTVPPNADLYYEVHLIDFEEPDSEL